MDKLIAWLPENIPPTDETTIVHGDFRLDNMVFHPTEPRILAVLDWELSTLGHPLADFSYHCMSWHIPPGKFRGIAGLTSPRSASRASASTSTCTASAPAARASTPSVLGFLPRLQPVPHRRHLQGIAKRVLDGTAASEQAREAGARAPPLAELGWSQVESILKRAS